MKLFTRIVFSFLLIAMIQSSLSAQVTDTTQAVQEEPQKEKAPKQKSSFASKLYYGGNIGLSFGSYTMVGIYPLVGYKITPKLSAGVKLSYQYVSDSRYAQTYTTNNYGWSVFSRYRLIPSLYVHVEYEQINYELYYVDETSNRVWVPFLFVGAGYSKSIGGAAWFNVQVLFDVLQDENSPYNNWDPFFSVGVGVGF